MNENPEGTPNPLNPVQGVAPVEQELAPEVEQPEAPVEQPAAEQPVVEQSVTEQPASMEQPATEQATTEELAEPVVEQSVESITEQSTPEVSLSAADFEQKPAESESTELIKVVRTAEPKVVQSMKKEPIPESATIKTMSEQSSVAELAPANMTPKPAKKSSKTGLLIAIILLVVAIITGAAAAVILLNPFAKADAVPAAIAKLMSGDVPKYVSMDGTVSVSSSDEDSLFTSMTVNYNGGINNTDGASYANAKVMTSLTGGGEFDFDVDEIRTRKGDLYLKLSNIYKELDGYYGPGPVLNDCAGDSSEVDNCISSELITPNPTTGLSQTESLYDYLGVFDVIDDEWIRIPSSTFSNVSGITEINSMPTQCLIDAAGKLEQYGSDFAAKYKQYPFINYSTDNLGIVKRANNLYRLTFDTDKLTGFVNSLNNSGFMNELLACVGGTAINTDIDRTELTEIIAALPMIYVEIDDDNNFTRLYMSVTTPDGLTTATADISLSYPSSLTINEPSVYIDINQALTSILNEFYQQPVVQLDDTTNNASDNTDTASGD